MKISTVSTILVFLFFGSFLNPVNLFAEQVGLVSPGRRILLLEPPTDCYYSLIARLAGWKEGVGRFSPDEAPSVTSRVLGTEATAQVRTDTMDPVAVGKEAMPMAVSVPAPVNHPERPVAIRRPAIDAPMPKSYTVVNGKMVCAKKHDKPGKSKKNKKKHMDMECCLDPDETPNPHCYYPPEKYGKYLK